MEHNEKQARKPEQVRLESGLEVSNTQKQIVNRLNSINNGPKSWRHAMMTHLALLINTCWFVQEFVEHFNEWTKFYGGCKKSRRPWKATRKILENNLKRKKVIWRKVRYYHSCLMRQAMSIGKLLQCWPKTSNSYRKPTKDNSFFQLTPHDGSQSCGQPKRHTLAPTFFVYIWHFTATSRD